MIEAIKNDELAKRIGGAFRLTALIQRRLKELIEGSRPLVDPQGKNLIEIAIQEIDEGKVVIDYEKTEMLNAQEEDAPEKA
ncbi:MAG: DNA-directed RNA polymerase subunit omega [Sedimentisphaerales bacterium]|nr:DNA-directed RNA polymerase subunit omega [Sedimentisphaerales bacterium]